MMKTELVYLVYVTVLTMLLWVPYILGRIAKWGLIGAVGYPQNPPPQSPWAVRMIKALVLAAHALGVTSGAIATAAIVYFWARLVHVLAYTFAIPWVRTLAFAVGFFAQAVIAWQIMAR
jgi:hypothetical protein